MEDVICDGVTNSKTRHTGRVLISVYSYFESSFLISSFILLNSLCGFFLQSSTASGTAVVSVSGNLRSPAFKIFIFIQHPESDWRHRLRIEVNKLWQLIPLGVTFVLVVSVAAFTLTLVTSAATIIPAVARENLFIVVAPIII